MVEQLEHELEEMKQQRKAIPHHLKWEELPTEDKCERLAPSRKRLMDTVKLIGYRAETVLMKIVREVLAREDDARSLDTGPLPLRGGSIPRPQGGRVARRSPSDGSFTVSSAAAPAEMRPILFSAHVRSSETGTVGT
ncbi:MAG: hypothetical protein E2P02_12490 [Acidobacteria bacterium]|nr:MAG: hypothetical protein E2P02_12490 [Acidobacteriota bacterium]